MAVNELRALLDIPTLLALAGRRTFDRGSEYVAEGRVGEITEMDDAIVASVVGGDLYSVCVSASHGQLGGSCSCPMGDMDVFCKHCVALSLAWLEPEADRVWAHRRVDSGGARGPVVSFAPPEAWWDEPPTGPDPSADDPVRAYLEGLDSDELLELVQSEMARDDELRDRVRLRSQAASDDGVRVLRRELDRATTVRGYLEYAAVPGWAADVENVADAIEGAISHGHADAVIDLAERGVQRVGRAIERSDDSDGYHGDLLRRFEGIHLAACRAARPDPIELARKLFRLELGSEWESFGGAAEHYKDLLGENGLAEYRRLAGERWADVPERGPGESRYLDATEGLADEGPVDEYTITRMLEAIARASGDVDELIAVMSRDLSSPYAYLEIAQVCRDAGRDDESVEWAERGLATLPERTDTRLVEFLAEAYLERDRGEEAVALAWMLYRDRPELESFQRLRRFAEATGTWGDVRTRALEYVRAAYRDPKSVGSTLVSIHAWESEFDAAWAAAHEFGRNGHELSQLARRTEDSHPEDALAAFKAQVADVLQIAGRHNYAQAIGLLRRIERIPARLEQSAEFRTYVTDLRAANSRRPAFCSMFDAAGFIPLE